MICRICASPGQVAFLAREMMLGIRTEHRYVRCSSCGSLQIDSIPDNLADYYDQGCYYSLQTAYELDRRNLLRAWLGNRLDRAHIFSESGFFGRLAKLRGNVVAERLRSFVADSPVRSWQARILDVGCGSGALVRELAMHGFKRAEGIDPYMPVASVQTGGSPRLRRVAIEDIRCETFDLVLVTHVLEHVEQPLATLKAVTSLLSPGGVCRIEVPVADSEACRSYREHWVELDPPRHLTIPSRSALIRLANAAGLEIYRAEPAGSAFEFWGSEMYRRGVTLFDTATRRYREPGDVFTAADLQAFDRLAQAAAARGESGRERFYLRRPAD